MPLTGSDFAAHRRSSSFLDLANDQLFNPHGIHVMVKNSGTDEKAPTSIVDTERLHSNSANLPSFLPELSTAAHLVFLEDYMPSLKEERVDGNKDTREIGQRRRRKSSTPTKTCEFPLTTHRSPKKQFLRAVRGILSGPRKEERGFMERVKSREAAKHSDGEVMEPEMVCLSSKKREVTNSYQVSDASYLLIVNYPFERSETISNLDQKMEEPPLVYERRMPAQRQLRRRQDYCVPTL
jgi:hypothetical protein